MKYSLRYFYQDLEATLDSSINPIDAGLKELEDQQRKTRLEHVKALIAEMLEAPGREGVLASEIEIDPTWLNKSTSKRKIELALADVMGYIKKQHDDLETGINAITKYAQAYSIDPAGWIDQLKQGQDVNYLITAIDNQVRRRTCGWITSFLRKIRKPTQCRKFCLVLRGLLSNTVTLFGPIAQLVRAHA
uniref:DUF1351 domain-containing protein n=1 Tax=Lentilactobacillus hilgardii TaxID=1588 RepID=UPI00403F5845